MTDRALAYGVALLVVALALATMYAMHDQHYRRRRWQLLEARLAALERSWLGEHD